MNALFLCVFLLSANIASALPIARAPSNQTTARNLSQLALAVARASYLPIEDNRFIRNGSIMENPSPFGKSWLKCPKSRPEMVAGLCYKPCKQPASWAFSKGVGPVCWGCPNSHPVQQGGLCYKKCPYGKPHGRWFLCFGECPQGYRNDGLTCFRDLVVREADNSRCPWYDKCGLTFSRGCSTCPAGYINDGCTCRRNANVVTRPRFNRGLGLAMRSYGRGVGHLPTIFRYDPEREREACRVKDWVGKAFELKGTEVVKFVSDRQKIVAFGFRGIQVNSLQDWLTSFNFHPVEFSLAGTKVKTHRGFKNRYDNIAKWFEREYSSVPSDYTILLTGHSVGGSEAIIAAAFAAGKLGRSPDVVITWGAPVTGAENFNTLYRKLVGCDVTASYVTEEDTIADIPDIVYGYTHVCENIRLKSRASNFIRAHNIYSGYGKGLERKYGDSREIRLGCDIAREVEVDEENVFGY